VQLKAIALSSWFFLVRQTIRVHLTIAHLPSLSAVIFNYSGKILRRFVQVRRLVDGSRKYHPPLLTPLLSISRNRSSHLDIYMAIAGAPTPPAGVCAPRPELKPPHYHGGPWKAAGDRGEGTRGDRRVRSGWGGCRRIRFANIGGNVASGFIQHPFPPFPKPPSFRLRFPPPPCSRRGISTPILRGSWWKMEIANPSVFPATSFIFKRLKNFFLGRWRCTSGS